MLFTHLSGFSLVAFTAIVILLKINLQPVSKMGLLHPQSLKATQRSQLEIRQHSSPATQQVQTPHQPTQAPNHYNPSKQPLEARSWKARYTSSLSKARKLTKHITQSNQCTEGHRLRLQLTNSMSTTMRKA